METKKRKSNKKISKEFNDITPHMNEKFKDYIGEESIIKQPALEKDDNLGMRIFKTVFGMVINTAVSNLFKRK